jgi:ABC-type oligopeptide transport system ATPase subunit
MIIIGYQGIGKSTLSQSNIRYIDLESGNFFIDGYRAINWYEIYCNIAEHLSQQGYTVFVSSHKAVRDRLKRSKERVVCCFPSLELKHEWINKLYERYKESGLTKDCKAYKNAKQRYTENIYEIKNEGFENIMLTSMNYNLLIEIEKFKQGVDKA